MRKKKYFKVFGRTYFSGIVMAFCLWGMTGCGKADTALTIPLLQEDVEQSKDENAVETGMDIENPGDAPDCGLLQETMIYVYVCGAVNDPGVVELPADSRVADALQAAGGFTAEARQDAINLAKPVQDGEMLRFPSLEEEYEEQQTASDGRININTADVSQLITLNGIGEARAGDIISYREKNGNFGTIEDIKKVPGIKDSIFEKIADQITVN